MRSARVLVLAALLPGCGAMVLPAFQSRPADTRATYPHKFEGRATSAQQVADCIIKSAEDNSGDASGKAYPQPDGSIEVIVRRAEGAAIVADVTVSAGISKATLFISRHYVAPQAYAFMVTKNCGLKPS